MPSCNVNSNKSSWSPLLSPTTCELLARQTKNLNLGHDIFVLLHIIDKLIQLNKTCLASVIALVECREFEEDRIQKQVTGRAMGPIYQVEYTRVSDAILILFPKPNKYPEFFQN